MSATRILILGLCAASLYGCGGCGGGGGSVSGGGSNTPPVTVATPTFSPAAGTYSSTQSVLLADATAGATIYYTTNGSTPTTASSKYTGALSISASTTIKALAVEAGDTNSAVASAAYTITTGGGGGSHSYSTTFASAEDPLSENGNWINGGVTGLLWHDCQSTVGFAFGTEPGTVNYDDSTCVLTGTWAQNQTAQVTVTVGTLAAQFDEVEVRLNTKVAANSITGYEINCSVVPGNPYVQIVKWNGGLGSFTQLNSTSSRGCSTGDVLKATNVNGVITAYVNGSAVTTATDTTFTGGSPGMGFYIQTLSGSAATANAGFGASAFSASD